MKNINLVDLAERASKGQDTGLSNEQLREVVGCLLALKDVSETAKLIKKSARHGSVKSGAALNGEPMHYKVPLHVVNNIFNLYKS